MHTEKNPAGRWFLFSHIFLYLLSAILFILVFSFRCQCKQSDLQPGTIEPPVKTSVEPKAGMFHVFMNTNVMYESGSDKGNLMIQNAEENKAPIKVKVCRKDTGEVVYESEVIPAGYKVETAKLTTPLPKGVYDCQADFLVLEDDEKTVQNEIHLNTTITVKQ